MFFFYIFCKREKWCCIASIFLKKLSFLFLFRWCSPQSNTLMFSSADKRKFKFTHLSLYIHIHSLQKHGHWKRNRKGVFHDKNCLHEGDNSPYWVNTQRTQKVMNFLYSRLIGQCSKAQWIFFHREFTKTLKRNSVDIMIHHSFLVSGASSTWSNTEKK